MGSVYLIIIDGLGVGAQEDAHLYGDESMNTLGHVCKQIKCNLPNLEKMGIGNIIPLDSVEEVDKPTAAFGKMREVSAGKDSTTGHWEIAGIHLEKAFPTYTNGFPQNLIDKFCKGIGVENILCNLPYSGTDVIRDFGEKHIKTGYPIVYTSADSVLQIACHENVASVELLYEWCEFARKEICIDEHEVGRVIARPFTGIYPFDRISDQRKDFSALPPSNNILEVLQQNEIETYSIGKVVDLFAGKGFFRYSKTKNNEEGISQLISAITTVERGFVFVNLIDTDQLYGHRLDPGGYAKSLEEFDKALPAILSKLKENDLLIITGDHGNDPCSKSTNHSREFVPLLVYPCSTANKINLGTRETFADIAVSIADYFNVKNSFPGNSFLK